MKHLRINAVSTLATDRNRYCGPAVISSVTGMNTGEAARLIRSVTRKRKVTGVHTHHVLKCMKLCGIEIGSRTWTYGLRSSKKRPTLAGWLKSAKDFRTKGRVFLVIAGNHFQLIEGRRYVCGITKDIVSIKDKSVKRRCRVESVYELKANGNITIPEIARKPKPNREYEKYRSSINTMKLKYGFSAEFERDCDSPKYWVSMPEQAERLAEDLDHDLSDSHSCYNLGEVASRMEEMSTFMEEHFA